MPPKTRGHVNILRASVDRVTSAPAFRRVRVKFLISGLWGQFFSYQVLGGGKQVVSFPHPENHFTTGMYVIWERKLILWRKISGRLVTTSPRQGGDFVFFFGKIQICSHVCIIETLRLKSLKKGTVPATVGARGLLLYAQASAITLLLHAPAENKKSFCVGLPPV